MRMQDDTEHSGGSRDNKPLNSFLRNQSQAPRRTMSRNISRTTSALSYKSARSAFEDEVSPAGGDFRSVDGDAPSLDLDRRTALLPAFPIHLLSGRNA